MCTVSHLFRGGKETQEKNKTKGVCNCWKEKVKCNDNIAQ